MLTTISVALWLVSGAHNSCQDRCETVLNQCTAHCTGAGADKCSTRCAQKANDCSQHCSPPEVDPEAKRDDKFDSDRVVCGMNPDHSLKHCSKDDLRKVKDQMATMRKQGYLCKDADGVETMCPEAEKKMMEAFKKDKDRGMHICKGDNGQPVMCPEDVQVMQDEKAHGVKDKEPRPSNDRMSQDAPP